MVVASIQINPCSLSFNIICSFVEDGTDLFKKLEQDSSSFLYLKDMTFLDVNTFLTSGHLSNVLIIFI